MWQSRLMSSGRIVPFCRPVGPLVSTIFGHSNRTQGGRLLVASYLAHRHTCRHLHGQAKSQASSNWNPNRETLKPTFGQRIKMAASFSFYSALVLGGVALSGLVVYYFVCDILLPTSDVQIYERAVSIVEKDPNCQKLLGGDRITAYGENVGNKWTRNRPIASRRGFDRYGREHVYMQFHVKGNVEEGVVRLEMVENQQEHSVFKVGHFDFRYLVLETAGERLYVIEDTEKTKPKKKTGFLGVNWGPKRES